MNTVFLSIGLLVAVLLLAYLAYVMARPERF
ncbi:MAG: K(+)-transporting ATPase subunit F [Treponema sp.]|nr:K(+)-transporting ATPase subunit F [Treponema sp.]